MKCVIFAIWGIKILEWDVKQKNNQSINWILDNEWLTDVWEQQEEEAGVGERAPAESDEE